MGWQRTFTPNAKVIFTVFSISIELCTSNFFLEVTQSTVSSIKVFCNGYAPVISSVLCQKSVLHQPLYAPDLAPCDFLLTTKLKSTLKGRRFDTINDKKQILQWHYGTFQKKIFGTASWSGIITAKSMPIGKKSPLKETRTDNLKLNKIQFDYFLNRPRTVLFSQRNNDHSKQDVGLNYSSPPPPITSQDAKHVEAVNFHCHQTNEHPAKPIYPAARKKCHV